MHTKGARITVLAVLDLHSDWKTIAVTFGVLCLVCVLVLLTKESLRERSCALTRLDYFLPFVHKRRFPAGPPARLVRMAH
ncbi:MAG: hypothetical protein GWQ08_17985 [Verrucomicrobiaceae bacterium]|nr:hypothetical protein [Verrucomicrobiaceae bacterium]